MAWRIKAKIVESCSCATFCPCTLGPAKPDQEWCSAMFGIDVVEGESDGVDLSGAKIVSHFELPGDFFGGIDKAKLYLDPSLSDEQRGEIDAIFRGEKGGMWAGMKDSIRSWLPSLVAPIELTHGDNPRAKVEGIGEVALQPIRTEDGKPTTVTNAPVLGAFQITTVNVALSTATRFSDPDMRSWESLGHGTTFEVEWSG